jgi:basic amino acid/polyamine antiporter, APA family
VSRSATSRVRAWSAYDAFIYSFMSVNLVTLGLYGMSFAYAIPDGNLVPAVVLTGVGVSLLVAVYAALIAVIPRAGGDYLWQSRILGGGAGFVLVMTGWWFILWHWTPIYANILVDQLIAPLLATIGLPGAATWFTTPTGIFLSCLATLALAGAVVTRGMETYARIQRICFIGGLAALAVLCLVLLFSSQADFHSAFNRESANLFGTRGDAYQQTIAMGRATGFGGSSLDSSSLGSSLLLVPFALFFLIRPNWGAPLDPEVRGGMDHRRALVTMLAGLWATVVLVVVVILLTAKTMGWDFYNAANSLYWRSAAGSAPRPEIPIWPHPVLMATWLVDNHAIQFVLIAAMGLWFVGWAGTLFLSSTRVIFAAALDGVLPSWAADLSAHGPVPYGALVLMIAPAIVISALYAYWRSFSTYTLDATLVIAVSYLGTVVAATILPWRRRELFASSPIAQLRVGRVPAITVAGLLAGAFLVYNLVEWGTRTVYGVNNQASAIYLGIMYALAILVYLVARFVRGREGIDLARVHAEIPAD